MDSALTLLLKNLTEILNKTPSLLWLDAMSDIQDQLNHLLHRDFILNTPEQILRDYPRYLKAIEKRLDKIQSNPQRERKLRHSSQLESLAIRRIQNISVCSGNKNPCTGFRKTA